ncbi:hypothetical protein JEQ12_013673 [Ovis aries]|uniref:Uncharacterized protein n=1 Tax=Ovis aries TaxID=9940 RepID=A0A836AFQ6_SHEEP|nr:hypothetical protein JEQ12_013673 [Ovis aries]
MFRHLGKDFPEFAALSIHWCESLSNLAAVRGGAEDPRLCFEYHPLFLPALVQGAQDRQRHSVWLISRLPVTSELFVGRRVDFLFHSRLDTLCLCRIFRLAVRERYEILFHQKSTALGSLKVNLILLKSDFHYKEKGSVIPPRHRRTRDSNQMTSSLISNTTILPGSCSPKSVKKILKAERC